MSNLYPPDPTRREPVVPDAGQPVAGRPADYPVTPAPGWNSASPGYAAPGYPSDQPRPARPAVLVGRLWAGGVATAVVAALVAVVGILVARGVLNLEVLAPQDSGAWGDASTLTYALVAFGGGLAATGLMHALLVSTPSPFSFFNWIMALVTAVAAVLPFTTSAALEAKIATAVINALIGIAIWTLTDSTAARSLVRTR